MKLDWISPLKWVFTSGSLWKATPVKFVGVLMDYIFIRELMVCRLSWFGIVISLCSSFAFSF